MKDEREKPLLFKRHKVVRFLISPKKKKVKIEVNKIMNPAFLLGTAFNIAYWHRKYHSGTICKGVSNPQTSLMVKAGPGLNSKIYKVVILVSNSKG